MSNILIGADVVPNGRIEDSFSKGDAKTILGEDLFELWSSTEYKFFNLECPITNSIKQLKKYGPNIKCIPEAINGIKKLYPTCVFLANNHIMDYSESGLNDTIDTLNKNNVEWIGVGNNINELKKTFSFKCDNERITVYNCCEHEFSIATETEPGANPYDDLKTFDEIKKLEKNNDYIIVIYHGGKECYRYPSPLLQKRCRKIIDSGASLVLCQHSHCIGCEEKYNNGTIVYGQGNFIFNKQKNEYYDTSILVRIGVNKNFRIDYIPIRQVDNGTSLAQGKDATEILNSFHRRSLEIKDDAFIKRKYQEFANKMIDGYMMRLNSHNIGLKILYKFAPRLFSKIKFKYAPILNAIECESHNELFLEGLKEKLKGSK